MPKALPSSRAVSLTAEATPCFSIGSDEVMELKADPSELITPFSVEYGDGSASTFGAPNEFNGGVDVQDFSALRAGTPILDADRDA